MFNFQLSSHDSLPAVFKTGKVAVVEMEDEEKVEKLDVEKEVDEDMEYDVDEEVDEEME